jgi:hypothetical protein
MTITALRSSHHRSPLLRPAGGFRRPFGFLEQYHQPHLQEKLPVKTPTFAVQPSAAHDEIAVREETSDPLHQQDDDARFHREEVKPESALDLLDGNVLPMFRQRLCLDVSEWDDVWTLKRANAVYDTEDDDETELREDEYKSPSKRQCHELYWDECCENTPDLPFLQQFSALR